jgi:hypothetical protein
MSQGTSGALEAEDRKEGSLRPMEGIALRQKFLLFKTKQNKTSENTLKI